jgi:hypothetical protein
MASCFLLLALGLTFELLAARADRPILGHRRTGRALIRAFDRDHQYSIAAARDDVARTVGLIPARLHQAAKGYSLRG